ncbi:hypothetical protein D3875_04060 [Deinococcus cavernae]|uniref:DUF3168 domain-containing protein n=1 Tax=Deinococcus cavernae TaxID=2320857 RepID=A0A418VED2_9DEIO|nr:hypothetical protein [Deinococcus cavernae]RJF74461.1 hypothetical protein D3875_04060 [Deinococcus cavernae]
MLVQDIQQRLRAALPGTVPVLLPQELTVPAEWEEETPDGEIKEGGGRGLHVYLRQKAPQGYVQVYDPGFGFTVGGWADNQTLQIDCIAPTDTLAFALARQVRSLIGSTPRRGGTRPVSSPPLITHRDAQVVRVTLQFNVRSAHP